MSLKRRILPRVRKSEANSAPVPIRVISLPDKAKGLRINLPGGCIMIFREADGTAVGVYGPGMAILSAVKVKP